VPRTSAQMIRAPKTSMQSEQKYQTIQITSRMSAGRATEAGRRFGEVDAHAGSRLAAPPFLARPVPRR
jgi:hypothetical protein